MGDIGDFWRDVKQHGRDRKAADALGISVSQYKRDMEEMKAKDKAEKKAAQLAKHTLQCECGRTFLNVAGHSGHKQRHGKKGHKGTPIERKAI